MCSCHDKHRQGLCREKRDQACTPLPLFPIRTHLHVACSGAGRVEGRSNRSASLARAGVGIPASRLPSGGDSFFKDDSPHLVRHEALRWYHGLETWLPQLVALTGSRQRGSPCGSARDYRARLSLTPAFLLRSPLVSEVPD